MDQAEQAIAALQSARQIFVVSEGVGAGLASAMGSYLKMIKPGAVILSRGPFDSALALKGIGPEDVVVGIGFTNYEYAATRALELARKAGAKSIGVIAQANCPIGAEADILLACSATEEGVLPSLTCMGAILFSLVYSMFLSQQEGYNRELLRFQETYADLTKGTARGEEDVAEDLLGLV
jgi:DNA-binding MurR/RpiR family transcriptional regulator